MSRPSFQFYPGDWRNNAKLRRCSEAARGGWIDILCVLHDSDEYGVVRWPLADLARAAGVKIKTANELIAKGVLKGADAGCEPYIWRAFHAGKFGDPVPLVAEITGPVWYSTRLVRDEYMRQNKGIKTRFSTENQPPSRRDGERQGDGSSASSSSPPSEVSKIVNFSFGKGRNGVEMTDENKLSLFHNWLAPLLGHGGWVIIEKAMDPASPEFLSALDACKRTARTNGKGWPHQWPKSAIDG